MKNIKWIIVGLLVFNITTCTFGNEKNDVAEKEAQKKDIPFGVGEKFKYAIKFLGITAGIGEVEVKEIVEIKGRKAYHIVATAKAVAPFAWFHRIDDRVESFIDTEKMYSLKLIKSLREGQYEKDITLEFDQEKNTASDGKETFNIQPNAQDFLSAFYYFRTQQIEACKDYQVPVHADGKNWDFKVKVTGKERLKTILQKQRKECFIIKPIMDFESVFKQRGDVTIWVTADKKLVPVYMKTDAMIGLVYATLIDVTLVNEKEK